jgi:hypothetical protein
MPAYRVSACAHNGRDPVKNTPTETIQDRSAIDAAGQFAAKHRPPEGWTLTVRAEALPPAGWEHGSYDFRNSACLVDLDN